MKYVSLSQQQEEIHFLCRYVHENSHTWNIVNDLVVEGDLDLNRFKRALSELISTHSNLRSTITLIDDKVLQQEQTQWNVEDYFAAIDLVGLEPERQLVVLSDEYNLLSQTKFKYDDKLFRVILIKFSSHQYRLLINTHHIIADGASTQIIWKDLFDGYHRHDDQPRPSVLQYSDYISYQSSDLFSSHCEKSEQYFKDQFAGKLPTLRLPYDKKASTGSRSISFSISENTVKALTLIAFKNRITLPTVFLSSVFAILYKYTRQRNLVIGTYFHGRGITSQFTNTVGLFVNVAPIMIDIQDEQTFRALMINVQQKFSEAYEHQYLAFNKLRRLLLGSSGKATGSLFQVGFNYFNIPESGREYQNLSVRKSGIRRVLDIENELTFAVINTGRSVNVRVDYQTKLFSDQVIGTLADTFKDNLENIGKNLDACLTSLNIQGATALLSRKNLEVELKSQPDPVELIFKFASQTPNATAIVYEGLSVSFSELVAWSSAVSAEILKHGGRGMVVPVFMDNSIELVIAFIAILQARCIYMPLDIKTPIIRLEEYMTDVDPTIVLARSDSMFPFLLRCARVNVDEITDRHLSAEVPAWHPDDPMYLMFTSGSTGKPKGVLIPYRGIINRLSWMIEYMGPASASNVLVTTRFIYDSSIWQILFPLVNGGKTIVLPLDFAFTPANIKDYIQKHSISVVDFVPAIFNSICDELIEGRNLNSLRSLQHIIIGGEEITPETVLSFKQKFPHIRLSNLYGPTEASIGCVFYEITGKELDRRVPIGKPINNVDIFVVDEGLNVLPKGAIGEICIHGICLATGYYKNQPETSRKFIPHDTLGKIYRTGDLGRYNSQGLIEYFGRIDDQIKIRGLRIEPLEIEREIRRCNQNIQRVIVDVVGSADKKLCAYIVSTAAIDLNEIRTHLLEKLPSNFIPDFFVRLDELPLSASGKVDKKRLPFPSIVDTVNLAEFSEPTNNTESSIRSMWSQVLDLREEQISIDSNFFDIGGHSLTSLRFLLKINRKFGIDISLKTVFEKPTIRQLAEEVSKAIAVETVVIPKAASKHYYIPSTGQRRLLVLDKLDQNSVNYNVPVCLKIVSGFNLERLSTAINELVRRHSALRAGFVWTDDGIRQFVLRDAKVNVFSVTSAAVSGHLKTFIRPFDLGVPPLMRAEVCTVGNISYLLMDFHHIIADGQSVELLIKELTLRYDGRYVEPLRIDFMDFAEWENSAAYNAILNKQELYWLRKFKNPPPPVAIPTDWQRPTHQDFKGKRAHFSVNQDTCDHLEKICAREAVTPFMFLLATFFAVIHNISDDNDIVVGVPYSGRSQLDTLEVVGMFANTLVLRAKVTRDQTFRDLLNQMKEEVVSGFINQDYPFDRLVDKISVQRDISRNPLFDLIFAYERTTKMSSQSSLRLEPTKVDDDVFQVSKVDLAFWVEHSEHALSISVSYAAALFKPETIDNLIVCYKGSLDAALANVQMPLDELSSLKAIRKNQFAEDFNF